MSLRDWLRQRTPFLTGTVLPVGGIVLIVLGFWLPFGFRTTGLIEEWGINARLAQGWQMLFVDVGSPMGAHAIRPLTFLPFAAAYALDPGSFLGYNLLHMLILIGKGIFAFALVRRLLPRHEVLAFTIAVLFIIYPGSTGVFTFRAINVHAMVMFYVASVYLLMLYWDAPRWWRLLLLWGALLMSLLIYESVFPAVALTPFLLVFRARGLTRRVITLSLLWWLMPLIAGLRIVLILLTTPSTALYQTQYSMQFDGLLSAIPGMLLHSFWGAWNEALSGLRSAGTLLIPAAVSAVVVLSISLVLARRWQPVHRARRADYGLAIAAALGLMLAAYAPFLPFPAYRTLYLHTLLLPSLGAAVVLLSVLFVVLRRKALFAVAASVLMFVASASAYQQHASYRALSLQQQRFLGQMLEIAPMLASETHVVVIDRTELMNSVWFFEPHPSMSYALQYLYGVPELDTTICFAPDMRSNTPGANCVFDSESFSLMADEQMPPGSTDDASRSGNEQFSARRSLNSNLLVLDYSLDRELTLVEDLSPYTQGTSSNGYQPAARIVPGANAVSTRLFECWPIEDCTLPLLRNVPEGPQRIEFDDSAAIGGGWRAPEVTQNGESFRWMVDTSGTLWTRLDEANAYQIQLRLFYWLTPETLASVRLTFNDTPLDISVSSDGTLLTADIAPGLASREIDQIEVLIDHLDTVPGTDVQLGVAADWLQITPVETRTKPALSYRCFAARFSGCTLSMSVSA